MKRPTKEYWEQLGSQAETDAARDRIASYAEKLGGSEPVLIRDPADSDRSLLDRLVADGFLTQDQRKVCPENHVLDTEALEQRTCPKCNYSFEHDQPRDQVIFARPGLRSRDTRWVVAVHGMNTRGAWQEEFTWKLAQLYGYAVPVAIYKYGRILVSPFLIFRQAGYVRRLRRRLEELSSEMQEQGYGKRPDVIAHSFGTLILYRALESARREGKPLAVGRVVLTGSVVPPDFDWSGLVPESVEAVLCHFAGRDRIVPLAQFFVPHSGPSGTRGFNDRNTVKHVFEPDFGHSDYFDVRRSFADSEQPTRLDMVMQEVWAPFLTTAASELEAWQEDQELPTFQKWSRSQWRLVTHMAKYLLLAAVAVAAVLLLVATAIGLPQVVGWLRGLT